jgi:hypothetical protein
MLKEVKRVINKYYRMKEQIKMDIFATELNISNKPISRNTFINFRVSGLFLFLIHISILVQKSCFRLIEHQETYNFVGYESF